MTLAGFSQRGSQLADSQIRVNSSLTQWIMWLNKSILNERQVITFQFKKICILNVHEQLNYW